MRTFFCCVIACACAAFQAAGQCLIGFEEVAIYASMEVGSIVLKEKNGTISLIVSKKNLLGKVGNIDRLSVERRAIPTCADDVTQGYKLGLSAGAYGSSMKAEAWKSSIKRVGLQLSKGYKDEVAGGSIVLHELLDSLPIGTLKHLRTEMQRGGNVLWLTQVLYADSGSYQIDCDDSTAVGLQLGLRKLGINASFSKLGNRDLEIAFVPHTPLAYKSIFVSASEVEQLIKSQTPCVEKDKPVGDGKCCELTNINGMCREVSDAAYWFPKSKCGVEVRAADVGAVAWSTHACPKGWRLPSPSELACLCESRQELFGSEYHSAYWTNVSRAKPTALAVEFEYTCRAAMYRVQSENVYARCVR